MIKADLRMWRLIVSVMSNKTQKTVIADFINKVHYIS